MRRGAETVYKVLSPLGASFSRLHYHLTNSQQQKKKAVSTIMTSWLFTAGVIERVRLPLRAHETTNDTSNHKRSFSPSTCGSQITTHARHMA